MATTITPTVGGTFLTRSEGGMEYGVDYGASGLLGAPVYSPLSGTVVGYETQSGWAPGRLLISTAQGLLGIGHIASGLLPGQAVTAGQQVGTIGDSSVYGGTPESNAHVEVMLSPSGGTSFADFTAAGQGAAAQATRVGQDTSLAAAALGGLTAPGSGPAITVTDTTGSSSGPANPDCQSIGELIASNAHGSSIPVVGGVIGAITGTALAPVAIVEWAAQPCKRWTLLAYLGIGAGLGLGIWLLFRRQAEAAAGRVAGVFT